MPVPYVHALCVIFKVTSISYLFLLFMPPVVTAKHEPLRCEPKKVIMRADVSLIDPVTSITTLYLVEDCTAKT